MLTARKIIVENQGKSILTGVDFEAKPGEVTTIIGPSGAGKSTLLRAITGEVEHAGSVVLNGSDVARTTLAKLALVRAVLPQATPLAFPFTVLEVVRLGLVNGDRRSSVPHQALARVGLGEFGGRFYQELSGGEQQRVQLARVLTQVWEPFHDGVPRWLFLDEPVSSLDIGHQLQVIDLVRDFARCGGGVVMVMHDLNLTSMVSDGVALIHGGRLLRQGSVQSVFEDGLLNEAYGCTLAVNRAPASGSFVLPQTASSHT